MSETPTLTKSEFAARLGRSPAAISKWIARKTLTGDALTEDGRINVVVAEAQLGRRLDPLRGRRPRAESKTSRISDEMLQLQRQRIERGEIDLRRARAEEMERRGLY